MTEIEISKASEIEYNALKAEQRQRIKTRDNMLYLQVASIVGLSTIFENFSIQVVALILPFVSFVFGWKYYINDQKVSEIAGYFKLFSDTHGVFGFEKSVKKSKLRRVRKYVEFSLRTILFVFPIVACAFFFGFWQDTTALSLCASVIYGVSGLILFAFFLSEIDA